MLSLLGKICGTALAVGLIGLLLFGMFRDSRRRAEEEMEQVRRDAERIEAEIENARTPSDCQSIYMMEVINKPYVPELKPAIVDLMAPRNDQIDIHRLEMPPEMEHQIRVLWETIPVLAYCYGRLHAKGLVTTSDLIPLLESQSESGISDPPEASPRQ